MNLMPRRAPLTMLVALLALGTSACGLLGDASELLTIRVPVTYTVPVSIPVAYPGNQTLSELIENGETSVPIITYVPIDLRSVSDELANADVVEEVVIQAISMEVEENTLEDAAIQPFEVRVGEPGTEIVGENVAGASWDSALVIGTTPTIEIATPPFTGTVQADINAQNQQEVADEIARLQFGLGMGTELLIPEGGVPDSSGVARCRFTLELVFVVDPL